MCNANNGPINLNTFFKTCYEMCKQVKTCYFGHGFVQEKHIIEFNHSTSESL